MWLLAITAVFSLGGLFVGTLCTREFDISTYASWRLPDNLMDAQAFVRAGWMHNSSYLGAAIAMIAMCIRQIKDVKRLRRSQE